MGVLEVEREVLHQVAVVVSGGSRGDVDSCVRGEQRHLLQMGRREQRLGVEVGCR